MNARRPLTVTIASVLLILLSLFGLYTPFGPNGPPLIIDLFAFSQFFHFILLGLWGIPWMLLGYVVFTHAARQAPARQVQVPGPTAEQ